MSRLIRRFALWILFLGIYMGIFYLDWMQFLQTPIIPANQSINYVFLPGSSVGDIARYLHRRGFLEHPIYFMLLARFSGFATHLKAGEYQFEPGTTPAQLLAQMVAGRVLIREITLVEGWTFTEFLNHIARTSRITHTLDNLSATAIMARLGYPGMEPEGLFLPNTYRYVGGTSDVTILHQAYQAMNTLLENEWLKRAPNLPYNNPYDALIVASLIEKEAKLDSDRARIAGVILRRIQKNMPLQIDSTIIYGLGERYNGYLTHTDLHQDNPYNTYLHKGLPPTPIAMPGLASLHAALHPQGNALYFVASGNGGHHFSTTLLEHTRAVAQYRARLTQ